MQQQSKIKATILQALGTNSHLSGYRLFKEVQEAFALKPFNVYKALYALEDEGWITGDWRKEDGRPRKHYKLAGRQPVKAYEPAAGLTKLAGYQNHN